MGTHPFPIATTLLVVALRPLAGAGKTRSVFRSLLPTLPVLVPVCVSERTRGAHRCRPPGRSSIAEHGRYGCFPTAQSLRGRPPGNNEDTRSVEQDRE